MIFKDVVDKSNFNEVYSCLLKNYDKVESIDASKIKKGYEDLNSTSIYDNTDKFTIVIGVFEEDGCNYYDVSGLKSGEDILYSLVFNEWEEWLGFDVDDKLIDSMTFSEITAHCFWEMTFYGWRKEEREHHIQIMNEEAESAENIEGMLENLVKYKKGITDELLDEIINKYEKAEREEKYYLSVTIEEFIAKLIEMRLVTEKQIKKIKDSFEDEDIVESIEKYQRISEST